MTLSGIFVIFVKQMPRWCNGSHEGLKIPWSVTAVRVRVPPSVQFGSVAQLDRATAF